MPRSIITKSDLPPATATATGTSPNNLAVMDRTGFHRKFHTPRQLFVSPRHAEGFPVQNIASVGDYKAGPTSLSSKRDNTSL
jgi:hypothetical protein